MKATKILILSSLLMTAVLSMSACTKRSSASKSQSANLVMVSDTVEGDSTSFLLRYTLQELGDFGLPAAPSGNGVFPSLHEMPAVTFYNQFNFKDLKYLHFLDGKRMEEKKKVKQLNKLKAGQIENIEFIPGEQAIEIYGEKATHGVVIIRTRKQ